MTVEELITKYKKGKLYSFSGIVTISEVIRDLEGLTIIEHNQKVKDLPKMMDVFIGHYEANHMNGHTSREYLLEMIVQDWAAGLLDKYRAESDWIDRNFCKFHDAVRYGYEVEEEPKYYVRFPFSVWNAYTAELEEDFVYLHHDITSDETCFSPSKRPFRGFKPFFDKEHIININKDYWPFAVPVEKEVAE